MKASALILGLVLMVVALPAAFADTSRLINYQGILEDTDGLPVTGTHDLRFSIYADSAGISLPWIEVIEDVPVDEGLFNVILGKTNSIPDRIFEDGECWLGIAVDGGDEMSPRMLMTGVPWAFRAAVAESLVSGGGDGWVISGDDMYADVTGNVGIGTMSPGARLDVAGAAVRVTSPSINGAHLILKGIGTDPESVDRGKLKFINASDQLLGQIKYTSNNLQPSALTFCAGGTNYMWLTDDGNLGLGTATPQADLEVKGSYPALRVTCNPPDDGGTLELQGASTGMGNWYHGRVRFLNATGVIKGEINSYESTVFSDGIEIKAGGVLGLKITDSGKVGIGTASPGEALTVRGNILVENASTGDPVVEIGEGLDYAEGFDVSGLSKIPPGTVLVIDTENPGKLAVSSEPYDSRVAGIAAGGQGLESGVRLGVGQFDCDVALAGRVYCNVDATGGAIEPGDLLTTSSTPGYAMKAADHAGAGGAVLGKAMEHLEEGERGQILVLVSLQ